MLRVNDKPDQPPPPLTPVAPLVPQPNGGALRVGNPGNKGNKHGRPASVIREALRLDFEKRRRKLREIADNKPEKGENGKPGPRPYSTADQLKALDLMAKYGMGQPVEVGGPDGTPFTIAVRRAED